MKFVFIILFAFFAFPVFGQESSILVKKEEQLHQILKELRVVREDSVLVEINNRFKDLLSKTLEIDGVFDYPFNKLTSIGNIVSQDKLVRIFSWNIQYEDLSHDYFSFILKRDEKRKNVTVIPLERKRQNLYEIQNETVSSDNWYGALYYDIVTVKRKNKTFYTLLGYDSHSKNSTIKLLDVLYFSGRRANLGYPLFQTKQGVAKRVLFEYSSEAVMSLKYNEEREKIIFDHLSPKSPSVIEFKSFYVPDMSYDAYAWNGKQWDLLEDIIAVNKSEGKNIELKVYDPKSGEEVSVPMKNKWINPEDANAPISGGTHRAVTPDDINKKAKTNRKSKKEKKEKYTSPKSSYKEITGGRRMK